MTHHFMSEKECSRILKEKWPLLMCLLPVKWYYVESPLTQWLTYHEDEHYNLSISYLEEELLMIQQRFPSSFKKWVGTIGVKGSFWSKRFESMVIFRLLTEGVNVTAIDSTIPRSKKELDIRIEGEKETVFMECTSLRFDQEMPNRTLLNSLQRKMKQLVNCPGQKIVMLECTWMPDDFFLNRKGIEDEIGRVLKMDKEHDISFVLIFKMDAMSTDRIIPISAYAAPWGKVTPLVHEILNACQIGHKGLQIIKMS